MDCWYLMPNPNHFLCLPPLSVGSERVRVDMSNRSRALWIGFIVIFPAWKFARFGRGGLAGIDDGFGLLTLGSFLTVAGVNTNFQAMALLRYVPIVGAARMPARFSIVATMDSRSTSRCR